MVCAEYKSEWVLFQVGGAKVLQKSSKKNSENATYKMQCVCPACKHLQWSFIFGWQTAVICKRIQVGDLNAFFSGQGCRVFLKTVEKERKMVGLRYTKAQKRTTQSPNKADS